MPCRLTEEFVMMNDGMAGPIGKAYTKNEPEMIDALVIYPRLDARELFVYDPSLTLISSYQGFQKGL